MNKRDFIKASLVGLAAFCATPASAEQLPLSALSDYFNSLESAQTAFTQINSNGSQTTGTVYIKRPGRMRFEYNGTNAPLVLASAGSIAVYDGKSKGKPKIYPLRRSPLNLILAKNVNLETSGMVVKQTYDGRFTSIIARDPKEPNLGQIQLVFTDNPIQLRQWIVTDQSRNRTTVKLDALNTSTEHSNKLFRITKP
ncbi:outer-membrane lipoprotein carrier protein [Amylibacter marinus]|uniref:Outer-membrane lipoprotein carrier protein n=1 Tax=Amylibacter marinus TaxID=1475483 RepID=A0ABQ5VVG9_9RHOB|nr:outer membrane lipoprotein carrier protein LolA [Amylibacter marinus]GLQ35420.1 outer-membrane lipoprotein carrier protein [Amylibacter marinus]